MGQCTSARKNGDDGSPRRSPAPRSRASRPESSTAQTSGVRSITVQPSRTQPATVQPWRTQRDIDLEAIGRAEVHPRWQRMLRVPQQKEQRESSSDRHLRDRQTLTVALDWMAEYLRQKGQNLEVIIIGHATTSLLSAQSAGTDDVDFFGTNLTNSQRRFLDEAAQYAREKMNNRLKYGWFNNLALLNLPWEVHRKATYTAVVQNECMYNGEGLKLLAADWMFALCGKLDSLATARGQGLQRQMEIDRIGAAIYLNRYIARWKQGPIPAGDIIRQAELYQTPLSEDFLSAIKEVRDKYKQMFFFDGIVGI